MAEACAVLREVAMREGMRREKATSGCGSSAMEVKEESVAPWKRELVGSACGVDGLAPAGMSEVTTATGCAVPRRRVRRSRRMDSELCALVLEVAKDRPRSVLVVRGRQFMVERSGCSSRFRILLA